MKNSAVWTSAIITQVEMITPTVRAFTVEPKGGTLNFSAGAHLQMRVMINGRLHVRSYSLVNQPDQIHYQFAVKRLDQGRGGSKAMWALKEGDEISVAEPLNFFALDLSAPDYLLIAGGIGVTPLVQMAQQLKRHADKTGVNLAMHFGARSSEELAFLATLQKTLGSSLFTYCAELGQNIDYAACIARLHANGQLYTCGPAPMLEVIKREWINAGRPVANLRFETFGSSGQLPTRDFTLRVPRHQLEVTVTSDSTLLEQLELAGIPAIYDCRRGECGLCVMDVLAIDGEIDHRDVFLSDDEKHRNNKICVCVSRAQGCITLDSAYRPDS
jgi:ferredoxin-NADP reductase